MFSGYIFVKCAKFEVSKIVMLPQIVAPLKTGKEMSVISEKEIELLRIIEQSGLFVSTEVTSIQAGDKVEIIVGPLRGYKGLCIEDRSQNHVLIAIEGINQTLKLKISKDGVKKL
jgi:transcription antitermination factor NusG